MNRIETAKQIEAAFSATVKTATGADVGAMIRGNGNWTIWGEPDAVAAAKALLIGKVGMRPDGEDQIADEEDEDGEVYAYLAYDA